MEQVCLVRPIMHMIIHVLGHVLHQDRNQLRNPDSVLVIRCLSWTSEVDLLGPAYYNECIFVR